MTTTQLGSLLIELNSPTLEHTTTVPSVIIYGSLKCMQYLHRLQQLDWWILCFKLLH